MVYIFLTILILIASILLIGVVLIQKSKGGGLASNFQGANQVMGVRSANNFVEKATWTLALVICVLSILTAFFPAHTSTSSVNSRIKTAPVEQTSTAFPTQKAPATATPSNTQPAAPVTPAPSQPAK